MSNLRLILCAWLGLLALLALTIGASFLPLGRALPAVSYGIAMAKAGIVVWLFMELKTRDGLQQLALAAGFVWLAFLLALTSVDALTRGWAGG
jgi:cytochrome c oxidase subunit 4